MNILHIENFVYKTCLFSICFTQHACLVSRKVVFDEMALDTLNPFVLQACGAFAFSHSLFRSEAHFLPLSPFLHPPFPILNFYGM